MSAKVNPETCSGCEACVTSCPVDAINMIEGKAVINSELCTDCGVCTSECPLESISMV